MDLVDRLLDLIFPSNIYCISCGKPIDDQLPYALCGSCVRILQWANGEICVKCGKPLQAKTENGLCNDCIEWPRTFERGFTCVSYRRMEREILHQFKYADKAYYCEKLAQLIHERIQIEDLEEDMIVPVPMYKEKQRRRGYNQAALLAQALARKRGKHYLPDALIRTIDTKPMSELGADERRDNVKGVFEVDKRKVSILNNKTILLVDDIFTTGSTVGACVDALTAAGAQKFM
jgi:competence protein ComFC